MVTRVYSTLILDTGYQENLLSVPFAVYGGQPNCRSRIKKLLTAQEIKVLELLFAAHTNEEISSKLDISLRTVKPIPATYTANSP